MHGSKAEQRDCLCGQCGKLLAKTDGERVCVKMKDMFVCSPREIDVTCPLCKTVNKFKP